MGKRKQAAASARILLCSTGPRARLGLAAPQSRIALRSIVDHRFQSAWHIEWFLAAEPGRDERLFAAGGFCAAIRARTRHYSSRRKTCKFSAAYRQWKHGTPPALRFWPGETLLLLFGKKTYPWYTNIHGARTVRRCSRAGE